MKIKKNLKFYILSIISIILIIVFFKTFKNRANQKQNINTLPVVKIAAAPPAVPHLISFVIQKQQFDKKAGYSLEIVGIDPTETVAALSNYSVDVAVIGVLPAVKIANENDNIRIFAPALKLSCPFLASNNSKIENLKDLSGKRIGTLTKTGATYPMLTTIFKKLNIDFEKEYNVVEGKFFALPTMLSNNEVDVIAGICDEISNGKFATQGNTKIITTIEELAKQAYGENSSLILSGLAARKEWLEKNDENISTKFLKSFYDALSYIQDNPSLFDDPEIKKVYELTENDIINAKEFVKKYNNYSFDEWSNTITSLNILIEDAYNYGYIEKIPQTSVFVQIENK